MSPFALFVQGLRDLFRERWEIEATTSQTTDVLDVLCNQLEEPWKRDSGATARLDLPTGHTLLLGVLDPTGDRPAAVRAWLDDDASGLCMRRLDNAGRPWPQGAALDGFELSGDPFVLCSLLDERAREDLPTLLREHDLELVDSAVQAPFDLAAPRWDLLLVRARVALEVARQLAEAIARAPERLRRRARADSSRRVRLEAARALVTHIGRRGVPREVNDELLRCGDHAIVHLAASRLLGGGRMELTAIASSRTEYASSRAAAAVCLCDSVPPPTGVLVRCLDGVRPREGALLAIRMLELQGEEEQAVARDWLERVSRRRSQAGMLLQHHARLMTALRAIREPWVEEVIDRLLDAVHNDGRLLDLAEDLVRRGRTDAVGSATPRLLKLVGRDTGSAGERALALLRRLDRDRLPTEALAGLLEASSVGPWLAALELARLHDRADICWHLEGLDARFEGEDLEALVAATGQLGASAQPVLLGLLQRCGDRQAITSVAIALGQCGDVTAVEPLLELERRGRSLGRQARLSIEQIQSRLGAVERGGLSLATGPGHRGGLSVAADGAGDLALAKNSDGES
jgi:hypothetical protein